MSIVASMLGDGTFSDVLPSIACVAHVTTVDPTTATNVMPDVAGSARIALPRLL